jgi:anthranilate synthase component 2
MVVMIDNYDSFTYNIVQYCQELGSDIRVVRNDEMTPEAIAALKPEKLILSPGPSNPDGAGITLSAIAYFQDRLPILGICLGHQAIGQHFGAQVVHAGRLMHGKTAPIHITHPESPLFEGIPEHFIATRYHSLVLSSEDLPACLTPTAYAEDDGEIMALEIKDRPIYGVQFHPESITSEHGHRLLENFLRL